jgi:nitrate reductase alpha subunit
VNDANDRSTQWTRRRFLEALAAGGAACFAFGNGSSLLAALPEIANPLEHYPDRDWEKVYRDQYRYDRSFTFVCAPNDTHNCRLRGYVRNGVFVRAEQNYDSGVVGDLYGNKSTEAWNPRGCAKGYALQRRVYGPYRLNGPLVRAGWKRWADDGFPSLSDDPKRRDLYKFNSRGTDTFVRVSFDEAQRLMAKAAVAIATTYSGHDGERRLTADGYEPEMIEACHGAGTRTMKLRGGMGLLGVMGKYGMYRWSNMLALLDERVRGVDRKDALGGRIWSNYTWHGDQAPGHPFVHGLQASDCDFNELRHAKLHIGCGKNLVESKMSESHWFIELMERGGKIVVITPEYSPAASKSNEWIRVRPGCSDTALFLGITRVMLDNDWYDPVFVARFTDFPLLIRTDTLKRVRAADVFPNYVPGLKKDGPSYTEQHLTDEQYAKIGHDFVVIDDATGAPAALTRDQVGKQLDAAKLAPRLSWTGKLKLADGSEVEATTIWDATKLNLRDYDVATVSEITGARPDQIEGLARDIWETTKAGHAVAIHVGEGINHWFHATLCNRAQYLPLMLTGSIGRPGAGCHTWAGNYKAALFQGAPEVGPGFLGWIAEDPFEPNLDPTADGKVIKVDKRSKDEEPAYWNHGDRPLIVDTPKYGRKNFTGNTHMPTPTKWLWFTNVNLFNNAKHAYDMLFNVNPKIDCIVSQDIEMTSTCEYSDIVLPALSWPEFKTYEITASCSNPFLQIWTGGVDSVVDGRDDVVIMAQVARALSQETGDPRFANYWKFVLDDEREGVRVYMQRLLDGSTTTRGYTVTDILAGKYGEPGVALMMFRTYPRIPFWENVHDDVPFWTDTGRLNSYVDIPEAILHGENFIVHREGPEATPYLPNVIVSRTRSCGPNDYGIPLDASIGTSARCATSRWLGQVKSTKNFRWEKGFQFYCLTPKTRHRVHSSWANVDWHLIWNSNFGDPYRVDKRLPNVGEHQIHMNPQAARPTSASSTATTSTWTPIPPTDRIAGANDPRIRSTRSPRSCCAHVTTRVSLRHGDDETRLVHRDREDREGARDAQGRSARSPRTGYISNFRSARSSRSRATGTCRCTRPTRCSTRPRRSWRSSSAAKPTTTPSTPCPRNASSAS